jgi:hypothetical protein
LKLLLLWHKKIPMFSRVGQLALRIFMATLSSGPSMIVVVIKNYRTI